jgi:DNA-directed RNA polymerase subunit RPC12/RpoP
LVREVFDEDEYIICLENDPIMKCPYCDGKPLSFAEFWSGFNDVRVRCRECGSKLKANKITWAWLLVCISIMTLFFIYLFANIDKFVLSDEFGKFGILLFVFLCAILCWFTGGYVLVAPKNSGKKKT